MKDILFAGPDVCNCLCLGVDAYWHSCTQHLLGFGSFGALCLQGSFSSWKWWAMCYSQGHLQVCCTVADIRGTALIWFTLLLQLDLDLEKSGEALSSPYLQLSYRRGAEEEATGQSQHSNRESKTFKSIDFECPYFWASHITHCKEG